MRSSWLKRGIQGHHQGGHRGGPGGEQDADNPGGRDPHEQGNPSVVSYRISVRADDLSKAFDPVVRSLRVKVREFIHYKNSPSTFAQTFGDK